MAKKKSEKQLNEALRQKFLTNISKLLTDQEEEVMAVKSNEIAIPTLDEEGNEKWIVITVKVPTGSRDDGEPYDGYGMALQYKEAQAEKEEKAKARNEKHTKTAQKTKKENKAKAQADADCVVIEEEKEG